MSVTGWVWFFLAVSGISLLMAWVFTREVLAADSGTAGMHEIAAEIKEGAEAFMKRQYITIYSFSVVLAILLFVFYSYTKGSSDLAWKTVISFFAGAVCSGLAGFSGSYFRQCLAEGQSLGPPSSSICAMYCLELRLRPRSSSSSRSTPG